MLIAYIKQMRSVCPADAGDEYFLYACSLGSVDGLFKVLGEFGTIDM